MGGPDSGRLVNPEYLTKQPIDLSPIPELLPTEFEPSNVGQLFKFTSRALKAFETFSLPSSIAADWKFTPVPTTTMRKASVEMISRLSKVQTAKGEEPTVLTLTGAQGSGKSTVMLQAVSFALHQKWIVLYIPDVKSLVDGQHAYEYFPKTQVYHQNTLSASILKMLAQSDLAGLTLSSEHRLSGTKDERLIESPDLLASGLPLTSLIHLATSQPHFAPAALDIALEVLSKQTLRPVLLALDGAQNLFRPSNYKDESFREIDSFVLSVPRALVRFARGSQRLTKGLTVLAASSLDKKSQSLAWDQSMVKGKAASGYIWPGWASYSQLVGPIPTFPKLEVGTLEREEAAGIARGLELTKQYIGPLSDRVFVRQLVASGGNAREFRREIRFQTAL
ncbi:hypothetical protein CROQUDRAFT_53932 [Cronartium quercuum f. sp. fusiforme G11]|uniref:Small ribosomal subunit protein mS29 n=1 Tax=Cronartium quercuum f. sp. fusiforme G11 TaxID=708437 RepID=A0A9P6N6T9_9BASI|nr:hypothetical protein CROQUDRAFT_53932 [Cronartium quercuum f. sp. fusiforme G11]